MKPHLRLHVRRGSLYGSGLGLTWTVTTDPLKAWSPRVKTGRLQWYDDAAAALSAAYRAWWLP